MRSPTSKGTSIGSGPTSHAVDKFGAGGAILLVDDSSGFFRADLMVAADKVTPATMAFLIEHSSGFICAAMSGARADRLDLPLIPRSDGDLVANRRFSVAVDASDGVSTGISAIDRTRTVNLLATDGTRPDQLSRPGHVMVLRADVGGRGAAAVAVRLCRITGRAAVAVIAPLMFEGNDDVENRRSAQSLAGALQVPVLRAADVYAHENSAELGGEWRSLVVDGACGDVLVRAFGRLGEGGTPFVGVFGRCPDHGELERSREELTEWETIVERHGLGIVVFGTSCQNCCVPTGSVSPDEHLGSIDSIVGALGITDFRLLTVRTASGSR
ncbi:3,4-dihydroxy-2-butanone-4-phosphate synthase [Rhodococcus sp. IEGM1428]|uniref:3,4-dihydroxy-2-butanone-4-phosphate synthase n=1 Tax=Rhodococcus sp. IEGM1428 TaxID=3392191 RepID=UPI003D118FCA